MSYIISPDLYEYIKTFGLLHGTNSKIEIHLTKLTDVMLDELLYWMNDHISEKQILICNNKRCIGCFPKEWNWETRTCTLSTDYYIKE